MHSTTTTPPSRLEDALNHRSDKQAWVNWLFTRVAPRYDLGNNIMSLGWHRIWKRRLVRWADVQSHHRVLDIACGTGDTTFLLAVLAHQGEVIGADINADMMALAEPKRPDGCDHVSFVTAPGDALPFADGSFDRVTCTYAGRGFPDWPAVAAEVHRVLAPGGSFYNLDFGRPKVGFVDRAYRAWMQASGTVLGLVLHGSPTCYTYIPASMKAYPGPRWLHQVFQEAGFEAELQETYLGLMGFNKGQKP